MSALRARAVRPAVRAVPRAVVAPRAERSPQGLNGNMLSALSTAFVQVGRMGEYCEAGNTGNPITSPDVADYKKG